MSVRNAPISSPLLIAMLLPIVMWIAAAGITWLVVDRLMVYPLRRLRANVPAYRPGETLSMDVIRSIPSQELPELGDALHTITRTCGLSEADPADGLDRLTNPHRHVTPRSPNNTQTTPPPN